MSGYSHSIIANPGILTKGARLLRKPFAINELLTVVREVLNEPRAQAAEAEVVVARPTA
jgi:DNA-binding response OmpR family regulator